MSIPDPSPNSGRVMQPGAAIVRTAPIVIDEAGDFDAAVADEVTEVDVAAEKPVRRRKAAVAPVEEVAAPPAE